MTDYIREKRLLPADEIDRIIADTPTALLSWQEAMAAVPIGQRAPLAEWMRMFEISGIRSEGMPTIYQDIQRKEFSEAAE